MLAEVPAEVPAQGSNGAVLRPDTRLSDYLKTVGACRWCHSERLAYFRGRRPPSGGCDGARLSEFADEGVDDPVNVFGHLGEGNDYGPVPHGWAPLRERYERKQLRFHAHIRGGLHDLCAIFEHKESVASHVMRSQPAAYPGDTTRFDSNDLKQPMLVSVVEFPQKIESVVKVAPSEGGVRALVWL